MRTCVGCQKSADKRDLIRIVRDAEGHVWVDPTGKANGRGAYLCPDIDCLEAAIRRKRIDSALRVRLKEDDIDRIRREFAGAIIQAEASRQGR